MNGIQRQIEPIDTIEQTFEKAEDTLRRDLAEAIKENDFGRLWEIVSRATKRFKDTKEIEHLLVTMRLLDEANEMAKEVLK